MKPLPGTGTGFGRVPGRVLYERVANFATPNLAKYPRRVSNKTVTVADHYAKVPATGGIPWSTIGGIF
jgi:hypothetical protein